MIRKPFPWAVVCLTIVLLPNFVSAQKLLRWKFNEGDNWQVNFTQSTETETSVNRRPVKMTIDMQMDMNWTFEEVNGEGAAVVSQAFTRMSMKINAPGSDEIEFDSASEKKPSGPAKELAAAITPMLNKPILVTLNDRGGVDKVVLSAEAEKSLAALPVATRLKELFSKEGIEQTLRQSAAQLPEKAVSSGDQWTSMTESNSPLGVIKMTNNYTLRDAADDQPDQDIIDVTSAIDLQAKSKKVKLKNHAHTGTITFDAAAGRIVESRLKQSMVVETPYRDTVMEVKTESSVTMTIRPSKKPAASN